MAQPADLHQAARESFDSALRSVNARDATLRALNLEGSVLSTNEWCLDISAREVYVIAIGKAAEAMALGALDVLGDEITVGLIIGHTLLPTHSLDPVRWQIFRGGHPLPTQQSLDGAQAAIRLLERANDRRALAIFLISGGGSAMIEKPCDAGITLEELIETNRQLISCGATIGEVNAVRRTFSVVKGGKLAQAAPDADQVTLIVSDTAHGDEASVASGPTLEPLRGSPDPREVVNRYRLDFSLPASILAAIREAKSYEPAPPNATRKHFVIMDNQTAIDAATAKACQLGFTVEVAADISEQSIDSGCRKLVSRLAKLRETAGRNQPVCLLSGGEFSCPLRGNGIGGRNSETAMRCAIEFEKLREEFSSQKLIALSAGTDGVDGNSPAAGAIADETTIARGASQGLNAETFLQNSDSYSFFNALGDTIITGPTGTNVRDLRILLASGPDCTL